MYKSVDVEVELDFDDVEDFINSATSKELKQVRQCLDEKEERINVNSLADEMKLKFLLDIFHKYTLEELEEKLNEKYKP